MGALVYSTELILDGPWLVDRPSLQELETLIERCWDRLLSKENEIANIRAQNNWDRYYATRTDLSPEERERKLALLKEEENSRLRSARKKEINLDLREGKTFISDSLSHALKDPALTNENPKGLTIQLSSGISSVNLSLEVFFRPKSSIRVSPEREDLSKEIFVELREWAHKVRVPLWQRILNSIGGFLFYAWLFSMLLATTFIGKPDDIAVEQSRKEAHQLLVDGISQDEVPKAIEVLLKIESKYATKQAEVTLPLWFKLAFWVGLVISLMLYIRPKLVIGIGKGVAKINLWRGWLRFISITVPTLIFTSVLWPYIIGLFLKAVSN